MCMGYLSDIPRKGVRNKWKSAQKYHKEKQRKEKYKTEEKKNTRQTNIFWLLFFLWFQAAALLSRLPHLLNFESI